MSKNQSFVNWRFRIAAISLIIFSLTISLKISPSRASSLTAFLGYYQTARLTASDMGEGDSFGGSLAISGNTAIIGAPHDQDFGRDSGSAYIFVYDPASRAWQQAAKLTASDAGVDQLFGASVAIQGDTAFVAAPVHSPGGLVYIFERNQGGADAWGEVRQIQGDHVTWADYFGVSIDVSGDLLIAGAYAGGDYDGSAYIFERDQGGPGAWGQVAWLAPADNPAYNYFGYSVAISGETAVGGAPGHNGTTGAANIFVRQPDQSWLEVAQVAPDDGDYQDYFGIRVDIDGDTLAAGSPVHDGVGAVYLFERDQGGPDAWGQSARLLATDGVQGDSFGQDVLVEGDRVFAGAAGRLASAGGIYIFARRPDEIGGWVQSFQLTADVPAEGEGLGSALAVDGLILLAGAPGADSGAPKAVQGAPLVVQSGAAYVYTAYSPPVDLNLLLEPNPVPEGAEARLTGSFSDLDPQEAHALSVLWGDGSTSTMTLPLETQAFTLTHTYLDDGPSGTPADPYTLTVAITDAQGGAAWAQLPFVVENISPAVLVGSDASLHTGESLQRGGSFTDPGADAWTGSVDYGDGAGPLPLDLTGKAFWLEHFYPTAGNYRVTVTVRDDDGGLGSGQFMVEVTNPLYWLYLNFVRR